MPKSITFKGAPLTLVGRKIKLDAPASEFSVTGQDLKPVRLADFSGKTKILTSFPSLDTSVCDLQVKELNLLARSVIIVDKNDFIRYIQIVPELTSAPDYADVLKNLESIINNPKPALKQELPSHCKPCEGGMPPLPKEKLEKLLALHRGWELIEDKKIVKEFKFKDFVEAKYFLDLIAVIAEEQGHHPTITIIYNKIKVTLTTHAVGDLSDNDFIMARIIDEL